MSLFGPPLPPEPDPPEERRQPEWAGPPGDVFPGIVAVERTLAVTAEVALTLDVVAAYPTGAVFGIRGVNRDGTYLDFYGGPHSGLESRERRLRLAVLLSDGRRTDDDPRRSTPPDSDVLLREVGGSGHLGEASKRWWLWPLPPPGPLTVALVWDAQGISETQVELDADRWRAAAQRARRPWDVDG